MGSEPDLGEEGTNGLSRDGSFFSLTSATSASYYTAKEDLELDSQSLLDTSESGSGDVNVDKMTKNKGKSSKKEERRDSSDESNSTTLGEADSLGSSSSCAIDDNFLVTANENNSSMTSSTSSENAIEVREDISRICNTIAETEDADRVKRSEIERALKKGSLERLRELAISEGGLLSNGLRTRSWPLLLNVSSKDISKSECKKIPKYYPDVPEKISNLVHLDVARVLKRFPPGLTDPQQDHLQSYLTNLICSVLQEKRQAYYYQGFHDISLTFLLVSISQSVPYLAYLCLNKMIETNLAPYMEKTMDKTHDVIHVLYALLEAENPTLFNRIVVECKCPVAFCLPWVLTWFSHTLPHDTDVFRLSDFILGSQTTTDPPYLIPIFTSASLVLRNAKSILEDNSLTDIASMHQRLSKLPSQLESQEPWLQECTALMKKYAGKEQHLIKKGIEIKALQNRLWNEDTNNNRRRRSVPARRDGVLASVGKFLFVRHRWTTVSVVILGTAFLLQAKYGRSIYNLKAVKSIIQGYSEYTPEPFRHIVRNWLSDDGGDE